MHLLANGSVELSVSFFTLAGEALAKSSGLCCFPATGSATIVRNCYKKEQSMLCVYIYLFVA